ncbi:hypothetical protein [Aquimarina sp. AU474]|uniref:hypothetical protein n=1 Tax=Aquimarina sp. AU474 TaxID=2108529 RepID=UPI000D690F56|nr:hypothetical protein [Aquimarina sp. AU474]
MKNKKKLNLKKMNIAQLSTVKGGDLGPVLTPPLPTVLTISPPCDIISPTNGFTACVYPESLDPCIEVIK